MANSPESVLIEHTREMLSHSSISQSKFIHDLLMPALSKAGLEKIEEYKTADEYEAWRSAKVRQMSSIINGHTNIPARWVCVWLDVLPEPYGSSARKEIISQLGFVDVPFFGITIPQSNKANLPNLFREVADVMEKGAVVASDGVYDAGDDPDQLISLSNELMDVLEACVGQIHLISKVVSLDEHRAGAIVKMLEITK